MLTVWTPPSTPRRKPPQYSPTRTGVAHHDIALILGSGWGGAADLIGEEVASVEASEIPGYDAHAVAGHSSIMRSLRTPDGRAVLVLGARQHYYQVLDAAKVAHGVRMAAAAGCTTLVVTNGCGSSRPEVGPGSVVLISDHINYTGVTPLEGRHLRGPHERCIRRGCGRLRKEVDPSLVEGVYIQFTGPQYETPAEVRMATRWGADLIGMSTALEVIAARERGMEVLGLSLVTNLGAGNRRRSAAPRRGA